MLIEIGYVSEDGRNGLARCDCPGKPRGLGIGLYGAYDSDGRYVWWGGEDAEECERGANEQN